MEEKIYDKVGMNVNLSHMKLKAGYSTTLKMTTGVIHTLGHYYNLSENEVRIQMDLGHWRLAPFKHFISKYWLKHMTKYDCQIIAIKNLSLALYVDTDFTTIYRVREINLNINGTEQKINGKKVIIDGVEYPSMKQAKKHTKLSTSEIYNLNENNTASFIDKA